MLLVTLFSPVGPELTEVEDIIFDLHGEETNEAWWEELAKGHRQVSDEDRMVAESQQETIAQLTRRPTLGALETRVGWFHETYEVLVGARARQGLGR
jgi:hypothetical protein